MALSSFADLRLSEGVWYRGDAHSRLKQNRGASIHVRRAHREWRIKLSGPVAVVGDFCENAAFFALVSDRDAPQILFYSARISHTPEKEADAAGNMLNRVNEWPIDFHLYRRRGR